MTKRQQNKLAAILGITLLILLIGAVYTVLYLRACPHWEPAEITLLIDENIPDNPFIDPQGMTQETRILPPEGYERVPAAEDSFLAYMRSMPLYPNGSAVYRYDGEAAASPHAAAVYDLSVGKEGYQQCADSIIRLYSEYFWAQGMQDQIAFHLSNGFLCDYQSWRKGLRVVAFGEWAFWLPMQLPSDSEQQLHNYLQTVMRYAGTLSLEAESVPIDAADARTGDFICKGGTPGHAVLIVDEAVNAAGERCYLLAQGYTPAVSCHIITGRGETQSPWYTQEQLGSTPIALSSYTFGENTLRRWGEGFPNSAAES